MKVKDSQPRRIARVDAIHMNVLIESGIIDQTNPHRRVLATRDRAGNARVDLHTTHSDQPRASSPINDN